MTSRALHRRDHISEDGPARIIQHPESLNSRRPGLVIDLDHGHGVLPLEGTVVTVVAGPSRFDETFRTEDVVYAGATHLYPEHLVDPYAYLLGASVWARDACFDDVFPDIPGDYRLDLILRRTIRNGVEHDH